MSLTKLSKSPVLSRTNLEEYQTRGVDYVNAHDHCALWVDCGLGKTAITLTALSDQLGSCMVRRALVVAPKTVAVETWPSEIEKWSGLFNFPVKSSLIVGTPKQRHNAASAEADIYIINVENLVWLVKEYKNTWPWDWVVLDESSLFKDRSTQRFKALKSVLSKISRITQLTGTPASNGLMNLWSQVFLLDRGERLEKTVTAYRRKYFDSQVRGNYTEYTIKEGADKIIHKNVSDLVFRLDGDDYLKMEPLRKVFHPVTLPDDAREFYKQLVADLIVELEGSDQVVTAINKAVLTSKLLQCANGAVYIDDEPDGSKEWKHIHDEKLNMLEHIVNETGSPVLVAYTYQHDLVRLQKRFPHAAHVKDDNAVNRWNRGEIDLMFAHPASAGHGLNLQDGGHTMVWFGLNWSLELYQQFNARLRRKGQTMPVICHHIVADETVDQNVLDALEGKNVTQTALLNALKEQVKK